MASHQIEQREDEHPHQIDEVPVQPGHLDAVRRRASPRALRTAVDGQHDEPGQHVRAVKAGEQEEVAAERRVAPGVVRRARALAR